MVHGGRVGGSDDVQLREIKIQQCQCSEHHHRENSYDTVCLWLIWPADRNVVERQPSFVKVIFTGKYREEIVPL